MRLVEESDFPSLTRFGGLGGCAVAAARRGGFGRFAAGDDVGCRLFVVGSSRPKLPHTAELWQGGRSAPLPPATPTACRTFLSPSPLAWASPTAPLARSVAFRHAHRLGGGRPDRVRSWA